jgi:excisionase family DNA binding protein
MDEITQRTYSSTEAATYLGVSKGLILKLAREHKIPAINAGKRVLFRKESLDKWMDQKEGESMELYKSPNETDTIRQYGVLRKVRA